LTHRSKRIPIALGIRTIFTEGKKLPWISSESAGQVDDPHGSANLLILRGLKSPVEDFSGQVPQENGVVFFCKLLIVKQLQSEF
jgi:hypothetical protein